MKDICSHKQWWWWGSSTDIVKRDGTAIVCVKFDEKSFPKTGYICDLSVVESSRKKGIGNDMMQLALAECRAQNMTFARLHVDAKKHLAKGMVREAWVQGTFKR